VSKSIKKYLVGVPAKKFDLERKVKGDELTLELSGSFRLHGPTKRYLEQHGFRIKRKKKGAAGYTYFMKDAQGNRAKAVYGDKLSLSITGSAEKPPKYKKSLRTGPRGGQYYMSPAGYKVYVT